MAEISDEYVIDREDGLFVTPHSTPSLGKLVQNFRKVWSMLPADDKALMMAFWRGVRRSDAREEAPIILLVDEVGTALAQCEDGKVLKFVISHLGVPDRLIQERIAHELGHVLQHATGAVGKLTREVNEEYADVILKRWGFKFTG